MDKANIYFSIVYVYVATSFLDQNSNLHFTSTPSSIKSFGCAASTSAKLQSSVFAEQVLEARDTTKNPSWEISWVNMVTTTSSDRDISVG